jgi:coproporphyrinogen III oxidase-like Fe-S oxidoreductase
LRLDRPLAFDGIDELLDDREVERLAGLGLVVRDGGALALTERGRFLGGGVTARLLA